MSELNTSGQVYLSQVLPALISVTEQNSELALANGVEVNAYYFLRDCRTLCVDLGRRTGNTHAVFNLSTEDDLIIVSRSPWDFLPHGELLRYSVLRDAYDLVKRKYRRVWVHGMSQIPISQTGLVQLLYEKKLDVPEFEANPKASDFPLIIMVG